MPQIIFRCWTVDWLMTMASINQFFIGIVSFYCLLFSVVHSHQIVLRKSGFQIGLRDLAIISHSESVKDGGTPAYLWKTGILESFGVSSERDSEVSFGSKESSLFHHAHEYSSFPQESSSYEHSHATKYILPPNNIVRRTDASAVNSGRVYQLKMCTGDYLRIGSDGVVSSVPSRFDLNTHLYFYQCRGPSAFRIKGVRSERFLAMNDAAMLMGITESASSPNCTDWRSVWFERLATFPFPPLQDITLLTYHVISPDSAQPWFVGFNRNGRPIAWNRQNRAALRQICFIKESR